MVGYKIKVNENINENNDITKSRIENFFTKLNAPMLKIPLVEFKEKNYKVQYTVN